MGRRIALLLTSFCVALMAALEPLASRAQQPPPPSVVFSAADGLAPPPGLSSADGRVTAMLQLAEAATSGPVRPGGSPAPQSASAARAAVLSNLSASRADVIFQTRLAYNGIAVSVPASELDRLRRLPGVAKVTIIPPKRPAGAVTGADNGLPAIANTLAQATGRGVRIGVIDRGIDYTHADFGGPGTPNAYAANNPAVIEPGTFPTEKVPGGFDFAGDTYDASTNPIPAPDPDPLECRGAEAHAGQGTLVAGLAAGFGVKADGTTYRGPYGPGVDLSSMKVAPGVAPEAQIYALKIFGCQGSTALLTEAIERALDPNGDGDTSDHLDVLVISLGTPFGSPDDPDAIAVDNAVRAGVVVVVAAGDTVSTFYAVSSPASARLAIAVGASDAAGGVAAASARGPARGNDVLKPDLVAPGVDVRSAAAGTGAESVTMTGTAAAAPQVAGAAALLRQLHAAWTPAQIKAALMSSATPIQAPPSLAGAGRLNVAALGAASMLAYGADGNIGLNYGAPWVAYATTATRTLQLENTGDFDRVVTLSATAVATETGVTVKLPPGPITVPAHSKAQATVELGIDPAGLDFTPDPATQLQQGGRARHYLAEHGGYIQVNSQGSAPGVRVRPAHAAHFESFDFYLDDQLLDRSLDSREVHEYADTTPGRHIVNLRRVGASPRSAPLFSAPVDLLDGKDYTLIVVGRPGALGLVVVDETAPAPPPDGLALLHFVNANRTELRWNIGPLDVYLDGTLAAPALPVGEASQYITVTPGTHTVAFYKAGVNPARGRAVARKTFVAAAGEAILVGTGRHDDDDGKIDDDEQRAFVGRGDVRVGGSVTLASVPFDVFPKLAADAHTAGIVAVSPGSTSFALGLRNTGARNSGLLGAGGTPRTPLASAFELEATSPAIPGLSQNLRGADVQYFGVTSSRAVAPTLAETLVYFGLSSYGPWSTPNEAQFLVYIDSNQDGVDDFVLVNTNWGSATNSSPTDVFISALYPLRPDGTLVQATQYSPWGTFAPPVESTIDTAPFNSAVMFQAVSVADLAPLLDPANPFGPRGPLPTSFCYHVETRARSQNLFREVVDRVPEAGAPPVPACANRSGVLLYDLNNYAVAPINTSDFIFGQPAAARPLFADVDGGQITGSVNPTAVLAHGSARLLVLHHHNAPFPQAEVVDVRMPMPIQAAGASSPRVFAPMAAR